MRDKRPCKTYWDKTDLPLDIKVNHFYPAFIGASTLQAWQRNLSKQDWSESDREKYYRDSRHTYNRLIEEIQQMPDVEFNKLPQELQLAYADKRIAKDNTAGNTAEILDKAIGTENKYVVPLIQKAMEEHIAEIKSLLEELNNIEVRHLAKITKDDFNFCDKSTVIDNFEEEPLFNCLKYHIPDKIFWSVYSSWAKSYNSYIEEMMGLGNILGEEEYSAKEWPDVLSLTDDFTLPILKKPFEIDTFKFKKRKDNADGKYPEDGPMPIEYLLANDIPVLITNSTADNFVRPYNDMVARVINGAEYKDAVKHYSNAWSLKVKLNRLIVPILKSHSYLKYTCSLCPGQ